MQSVPGWVTDTSGGYSLREWDEPRGDAAPGTLKFEALSGIDFRYYTRGAVTRVMVEGEHPLTVGMETRGEWVEIPYAAGGDNFKSPGVPGDRR